MTTQPDAFHLFNTIESAMDQAGAIVRAWGSAAAVPAGLIDGDADALTTAVSDLLDGARLKLDDLRALHRAATAPPAEG